jgi:hypothetical protein
MSRHAANTSALIDGGSNPLLGMMDVPPKTRRLGARPNVAEATLTPRRSGGLRDHGVREMLEEAPEGGRYKASSLGRGIQRAKTVLKKERALEPPMTEELGVKGGDKNRVLASRRDAPGRGFPTRDEGLRMLCGAGRGKLRVVGFFVGTRARHAVELQARHDARSIGPDFS